MEAVKRTLVLMGVVNDCNVVLRRMAAVRDAWAVLRAHECMAAIVLGDAVLIHAPDRQDRAEATTADRHRRAAGCVSASCQRKGFKYGSTMTWVTRACMRSMSCTVEARKGFKCFTRHLRGIRSSYQLAEAPAT
jgi:hypothetical protein